VRTTARCRQDGCKGDLVQLESLDTKEMFNARVIGTREAAVANVSEPLPREQPRLRTAQRR
jgi:hypothetical protein